MQIAGSHILITGASSGIGEALAAELGSRGARLALVSRRAPPSEGNTVIAADLASEQDRARCVNEALSALGHIDILINTAGAGIYAPSSNTPLAIARHMFEVNLFAAIDLTQRLVPGMVQRRSGRIVNISSIAGKVTLPWFTLYSASKSALEAFTRGLRVELRGTGVGATLVCPGYVKTGFQKAVLAGWAPARLAHNRRFASTAAEVAQAIARSIENNTRTAMIPAAGWTLVAAARLAPGWMDNRLGAMMDTAEDE